MFYNCGTFAKVQVSFRTYCQTSFSSSPSSSPSCLTVAANIGDIIAIVVIAIRIGNSFSFSACFAEINLIAPVMVTMATSRMMLTSMTVTAILFVLVRIVSNIWCCRGDVDCTCDNDNDDNDGGGGNTDDVVLPH